MMRLEEAMKPKCERNRVLLPRLETGEDTLDIGIDRLLIKSRLTGARVLSNKVNMRIRGRADGNCRNVNTYRDLVFAARDRRAVPRCQLRGPNFLGIVNQGMIVRTANGVATKGDVVVAAVSTAPANIMKARNNSGGSVCLLDFAVPCMGHEIPDGMGAALARDNRDHVFVIIGDGTHVARPSELGTAVSEGLKLTLMIIKNGGFQCTRMLRKAATDNENPGNGFRHRTERERHPDGECVRVDYAMNARSMGCQTLGARAPEELREALEAARRLSCPSVVVAH